MRGEDAVHVHAVIAAVAVGDRGRIGGVEVGEETMQENLPGLVVIDRDGAFRPFKRSRAVSVEELSIER